MAGRLFEDHTLSSINNREKAIDLPLFLGKRKGRRVPSNGLAIRASMAASETSRRYWTADGDVGGLGRLYGLYGEIVAERDVMLAECPTSCCFADDTGYPQLDFLVGITDGLSPIA